MLLGVELRNPFRLIQGLEFSAGSEEDVSPHKPREPCLNLVFRESAGGNTEDEVELFEGVLSGKGHGCQPMVHGVQSKIREKSGAEVQGKDGDLLGFGNDKKDDDKRNYVKAGIEAESAGGTYAVEKRGKGQAEDTANRIVDADGKSATDLAM